MLAVATALVDELDTYDVRTAREAAVRAEAQRLAWALYEDAKVLAATLIYLKVVGIATANDRQAAR